MKPGWAIAFGLVSGLLAAGLILLASSPPRGEAVRLAPPPTPAPLWVHVTGAVDHPEVYSLPVGSRVRDAIAAAGGLQANADDSGLNLAAHLEDGEQILVPFRGQNKVSAAGPAGTSEDSPLRPAGAPVNINSASLEELDSLPGIGPSTAQKIIDYREENGPFQSIEAIQDVPGIGPVTFEEIQSQIVANPNP